jgi:DnaK suppressor protein
MSRVETEARELLLHRRRTLAREAAVEPAGRELVEIDAALLRIDEGSYGRCQACGGPMGLQRIRAIPEARFCVGCSSQVLGAGR